MSAKEEENKHYDIVAGDDEPLWANEAIMTKKLEAHAHLTVEELLSTKSILLLLLLMILLIVV